MTRKFHVHKFPQLTRIDSPSGRVYSTATGLKYPSVTSVLGVGDKSSLLEWRRRVGEEEANRVSARAASRGTAVHTFAEKYLLGEAHEVSIFDQQMTSSLIPHLDRIDNIHALESKLYSDHLQIAGTVDCIAEYDSKLSIIDFKTSKRIKTADQIESYFIQTSAYAVAFEELTGIPVSRLVIIMGVDEEQPCIFHERRDRWIDKFIELREEYRRLKGI